MRAKARILRWRITDWFTRGFALKLMFLGLLGVVSGFVLAPIGFVGNLLAEFFGMALGVFLTVVLVDAFDERRHIMRWTPSYNLTLRAISAHLYELFAALPAFFPIRYAGGPQLDASGRTEADGRNSGAMSYAIDRLSTLPSFETSPDWLKTSLEYHERVLWDLDQVQAVLVPRLIGASAESALLEAAYQFDNGRRDLHHAILAAREARVYGFGTQILALLKAAAVLDLNLAAHLRAELDPRPWA